MPQTITAILGQSYDVDYGLENGKIVNNVIPLPRHSNRSLETPPLKSAWYSIEKVVFWATPTLGHAQFVTFLGNGVERQKRAPKCVESSH